MVVLCKVVREGMRRSFWEGIERVARDIVEGSRHVKQVQAPPRAVGALEPVNWIGTERGACVLGQCRSHTLLDGWRKGHRAQYMVLNSHGPLSQKSA